MTPNTTSWRWVLHHCTRYRGAQRTVSVPGPEARVLREARGVPLAPGECVDVLCGAGEHWRLVGRRRAGGALLRLVPTGPQAHAAMADEFEELFV